MNEQFPRYGNSKTAKILEEKIAADYKLSRKVSFLLSQFNQGIKIIGALGDKRIRDAMYKAWLESFHKRTNELQLPADIGAYVNNVMIGKKKGIERERKA